MKLHKSQVRDWLQQAQNEDTIKKLNKPVRYEWHERSSGNRAIESILV